MLDGNLKKCECQFAEPFVCPALRGGMMGGLVQSMLVFRVSLPIRREPVVFILDSLLENKTIIFPAAGIFSVLTLILCP